MTDYGAAVADDLCICKWAIYLNKLPQQEVSRKKFISNSLKITQLSNSASHLFQVISFPSITLERKKETTIINLFNKI